MYAAMRPRHPAAPRGDERLRRMERGEIGISPGILTNPGSQDDTGPFETILGLVEMLGYLRSHRSRPSSRISRIIDVRSI